MKYTSHDCPRRPLFTLFLIAGALLSQRSRKLLNFPARKKRGRNLEKRIAAEKSNVSRTKNIKKKRRKKNRTNHLKSKF